jgi:AbrB family looped-hinge helix DNA binding protein
MGISFSPIVTIFVLCYNLTGKIKEKIMETLATTRMSSKGQVVIPESIRKRLNIQEGAQFLVVGDADVVILKVVTPPDMDEFDALIKQARKQAKEAGLKPTAVTSAVAKARARK